MLWPKCPGLLSARTLLRVQLLAWLLEFLNKGPCRLLVHACLLPVADSCPGGQRLRTQVMPAHLPLWKREEFLVCSHRPLAGASGFFPGRHCLNGTWTFPFLPLLMHTHISISQNFTNWRTQQKPISISILGAGSERSGYHRTLPVPNSQQALPGSVTWSSSVTALTFSCYSPVAV